jgi:fructose/tagatose bisphosphate aldolase
VRAALRAAKRTNAGALIFEIARSEMSYCELPPAEYSAMVIAAAIKEGYFHPLFIQGDHFQVKAAKYKTDPEGAIKEVKDLIKEAMPAGFWNIDIDTSTLVTLEPETLAEQQKHNYERSAEITQYIRDLEPAGVTISLGGEIGEVGEKNSTPEELDAYMQGYETALKARGDFAGLSKISVQTGTSHGGIVLPDGSDRQGGGGLRHAQGAGRRARVYGAGGAVQHGASTLPEDFFNKFPEVETLEIHLATGFMNLFMDHPAFPAKLSEQIHKFLDVAAADERKANMTDAQFYYKSRKKALGPFKPEMWGSERRGQGSALLRPGREVRLLLREAQHHRHARPGRPDRDRGGISPAAPQEQPRGRRRPGAVGLRVMGCDSHPLTPSPPHSKVPPSPSISARSSSWRCRNAADSRRSSLARSVRRRKTP